MALELRMNNVGDGYVQSCCFADINQLVFFTVLVAVAVVLA